MRARLIPPRVAAMRYHNRRSVNRPPHPLGGNLGCGTSIEHPIRKRSNITIEIVKIVGAIPREEMWLRKAKGWFLEFRLIPVLLWSFTAVVLGTAVAYHDAGNVNLIWFAVALALGGLIQGWETHAINEIYDWRSGTDQVNGGRALSGGSHVRNMALLGEGDLWSIFALSSVAVAALTIWVVAAAALTAHALVCMAMLVVHHYLDAPMDAAAQPPKRTTVVALGLKVSRWYAASMAATAAGIYAVLGIVHPAFLLGAGLTLVAVWCHVRVNPTDLKSVTRNELRVIQLGIAAGLATAVALAPPLWPMLPLAVLGYFAHLAVVAPPAELARAWRKAPIAKSATERP